MQGTLRVPKRVSAACMCGHCVVPCGGARRSAGSRALSVVCTGCCAADGPRPEIFTLQLAGDLNSYAVAAHCWVAFNLSDTITGFQDIQFHTDAQGGVRAAALNACFTQHRGHPAFPCKLRIAALQAT